MGVRHAVDLARIQRGIADREAGMVARSTLHVYREAIRIARAKNPETDRALTEAFAEVNGIAVDL